MTGADYVPDSSMLVGTWPADLIDTATPHSARIWDYLRGGRDNYHVDREIAENLAATWPWTRENVGEHRAFARRAVGYLAGAGVTQFLDIGCGIPRGDKTNTADLARATAPGARVVYVDNDPIVITHGRGRLVDYPASTAVVHADLRDPRSILEHHAVRTVLDFDEPIAVLLTGVLPFVMQDPAALLYGLIAPMAPGSALALSHESADFDLEQALAAAEAYGDAGPVTLRTKQQIQALFHGLELAPPGVVALPLWQPDGEPPPGAEQVWAYGAVGLKPLPALRLAPHRQIPAPRNGGTL